MLTNRQIEVLKLVCCGQPYKCVASDLGVSEEGVQRHMDNIRKTVAIPSLALLVQWALAEKIVKNPFMKTKQRKTVK